MTNNIDLKRMTDLNRRNALKQLAAFCGLAISASSLELLAADSHSINKISKNSPGLLSKTQIALVQQLGEIIIPATETPGAIGAGVHSFIDRHITACFSPEEQQQLVSGLARIDNISKKLWRKIFIKILPKQQIALLTDMEKAQGEFDNNDRIFFKQFKGLVMFGYYTSEIGAAQELAYLAIPGNFKGDVKFNSLGKAWAL
ncbi:MAG: gluconate 2-dehydrogenase subunit 3 family protein [Pseudomonadota bacterium]